jgi:putative zinc finger/helix-turn-helix YgiT family protein
LSRSYCETCGSFVEPDEITRDETYLVKGEPVTVTATLAICPVSGDELSNEALDDETLCRAFAVYRARHGLLQPDEIKSIRLKYGLGQKAFSRLLGWGEVTLHRYESGSLQTAAQNTLLELARDPGFVSGLLERNTSVLSQRQRETLRATLRELVSDCAESVVGEEGSGYGETSSCVVKLREMMVYFAGRPKTFRTKLNKLLFYADFLHQKRYGRPISAVRYVHLQFGPVPYGFYRRQDELVSDASLREIEIHAGEWGGTRFEAGRPADLSIFSPSELECVGFVADRFQNWSAKRLTELSHGEAAWRDTRDGETISYAFAGMLSLD